jgi:hypothetical protein
MIMSIVRLFPGTSNPQNIEREKFEREVATRFGLVPNFFRSAPDAPHVIRELWAFAKSAYLDTPIPTLFKERLFVYLSRFCEVRYCITRHCGFLLGLGRAAGDPNARAMTINQVIRLLQRSVPTEERTSAALARLEAITGPIEWPSPETSYDDDLLTSVTVLFLQPGVQGGGQRPAHELGGPFLGRSATSTKDNSDPNPNPGDPPSGGGKAGQTGTPAENRTRGTSAPDRSPDATSLRMTKALLRNRA